jgi:hypothetical protein
VLLISVIADTRPLIPGIGEHAVDPVEGGDRPGERGLDLLFVRDVDEFGMNRGRAKLEQAPLHFFAG